ncbi:hypothetical protein LJC63_03145 [Ruminococcaceae bacterium OttesenSCG-928-L11]|nr:hypothetical protein [Ruminococcaceae bacterium OttesenSCG-928-L11]
MKPNTVLSPRVNELYRSPLRTYIDLNGQWDFQLDPDNTGEEKGFPSGAALDDTIVVPGCLEAQQKGLHYGPIVQPGWSGSSDVPYFGTSWYRKTFAAPAALDGVLMLNFGGVSTDCRVWLNGEPLCEHPYGSVAFGVDVSDRIRLGRENTLVVRVENNHTYETNSPAGPHGFGSSTTEMRWSGIYRGVELVAAAPAHLTDLFVRPDARGSRISLHWEAAGIVGDGWELDIAVKPVAGGRDYSVRVPVSADTSPVEVEMPDALLWSDDAPHLYTACATLHQNDNPVDSLTERFGLRDISVDDKHILLNGKPVYLRGEMTHFHWPGTISPCTDREDLRQKLGVYKQYGMNFMRHHTYTPHPEYLEVCDELGLLCHNELGIVSNAWQIGPDHSPTVWQATVRAHRNHPSVIIWCMGNEAIHDTITEDLPNPQQMAQYKQLTFALDDTRLLQDNSPGFFHFPDNRPKQKAPIHHELRKSGSSYIDPAAKRHYTGALRPWRMLWAETRTKESGIDHLLPVFVRNTQRLQGLTRKYVLEELRLNAVSVLDEYYHVPQEYQGYELSTFRDSGSFVWGTVDDYCEPKAVTAEEFRQSNNASVLLWEYKWWDRLFVTGKTECFVPVALACSHFGKQPIQNGQLRWRITADGAELVAGERDNLVLRCGEVSRICDTRFYLPACDKPVKMELEATLTWEGGAIRNAWPFWCFPKEKLTAAPCTMVDHRLDWVSKARIRQDYPFIQAVSGPVAADSVLLTATADDVLFSHLARGGRAMLLGRDCFQGEVTEWGAARSEYARGTILSDHPLANCIPHDGFCDIPYHGMISGRVDLNGRTRNECGFAIGLRDWPARLTPIVAGIPSYKAAKPQLLAHLFEVRVGKGRLLVTTFDFCSHSARNPATAYYFDQVLRYLASDAFDPAVPVTPEFLRQATEYAGAGISKPTF